MKPGMILTHQQKTLLLLVERAFENVFLTTGKIPVCIFVDATTWAKFEEFCPLGTTLGFEHVRTLECNGVPVFMTSYVDPGVGWLYVDQIPPAMRPPDHVVVFE